ncbi:SDR family oxidoreductase [Aliiglaciecola sp. CAU 1673]|uniref:SDR family oxidoreductase n=1 Tax=Aliiglaciecola sp. CAU 1673 TaxID=3032595 RepID=UPI0023DCC1A1|nr:SDR family oxidoreductase [Aliiglaciecola sp. CAU 1673]MDF2178706.1 SDR family oxidoreductase [Aliiglaciecola sp. CAU 1673]
MQLSGKRIWLTGASMGIGEALAQALADAGASLILSARSLDKLQSLKASLPHAERHTVVQLDLADADSLAAVVADTLGNEPGLDVLINNGGISQRGLARETDLSVQRQVMEVNYFGTIALTQAILPHLLSRQGMVVNIASVAGKVGGQSMSGYSASKHALIGYMDCLRAEETVNGLKVLNVCPGFVQTNISVNALTEHGDTFGKVARSIAEGITPQECANAILKAMEKEKYEVVIGKGLSGWAPTIKRWLPNLFFRITANKNIR